MGSNTTIVRRRNHLNSQFAQDFETSLNDWGTVVLFIRDDTVQSCTTQYQEKAGTRNFHRQMTNNYSSNVNNISKDDE